MNNNNHLLYDKISDDIYYMGKNTILKFNVSLSRNIDNMRSYFHKEFEYNSKYANANTLVSIRRQFDFYLSIENVKIDEISNEKAFILIGITEIMIFKYKLKDAIKWFRDKEFQDIYGYKNGKLIMTKRLNPIVIGNLPMNKYISMEPVVCDTGDDRVAGVRVYLSSENNYVDMTVDRFMGLYYIIDTINMYESAQLMVNYLGKPDYGTNRYSFSDGNDIEYADNSGSTGRKIPIKNKGLKGE